MSTPAWQQPQPSAPFMTLAEGFQMKARKHAERALACLAAGKPELAARALRIAKRNMAKAGETDERS